MAITIGGNAPVNANTLEGNDSLGQPISTAVRAALDNLGGGSFTPVDGGGVLTDEWYHITDSGSYTLPAITPGKAQTITLLAANDQTPTITSSGGEIISLDADNQDTSVIFTKQSLMMLVSNVTYWDMIEISIDGANTHTHYPSEVGLPNVDNTSDLDKPISTLVQSALDTLTASVSNVDNTSDLDKPISTSTQSAIDTVIALTETNKLLALGVR